MQTISTHEAKTHLSRYLARAEAGAEIVIARGRKPVARLVPLATEQATRRPKVGRTCGARFAVPAAALTPLSKRELKTWGL